MRTKSIYHLLIEDTPVLCFYTLPIRLTLRIPLQLPSRTLPLLPSRIPLQLPFHNSPSVFVLSTFIPFTPLSFHFHSRKFYSGL
jgi:hypothetical protein